MKRTITAALLFCMAQMIALLSGAKPLEPLMIRGEVMQKARPVHAGTLKFKVYDDPSLNESFGFDLYAVPLEEGKYEVEIPCTTEYFYMDITLIDPGQTKPVHLTYYTSGRFLFRAGDNITMDIRDRDMSFEGRGAAKLNCQKDVFRVAYEDSDISLMRQGKYYRAFESMASKFDEAAAEKRRILQRYKGMIDSVAWQTIDYDIAYLKKWKLSRSLGHLLNLIPLAKTELSRFYDDYFVPCRGSAYEEIRTHSAYYSDYRLEYEKIPSILANTPNSGFRKVQLDTLYHRIGQNYSGPLRSKLWIEFLMTYASELPVDKAIGYYQTALSHIRSPAFRDVLITWADIHLKDSPMFDFRLVDTAGVVYTLEDFRGDVVVFDFWFRGCQPCIILDRQMKPIIESFRENPNVKFVSVNVDSDKRSWLDALKLGQHSSEDKINLYTNGLGRDHPLIRHYGFVGYPQLLIMDTNGRKIKDVVPRPNSEAARREFTGIIDRLSVE